jgi:deoxyadenosine/deoxycytidine kinase
LIIIVEGGDGVGKTTFVEQLHEDVPLAEVRHKSQPKQGVFFEYEDLDDYPQYPGQDVFYDRQFVGELIYGPLYRETSLLDPAGLVHVELYLRARGALLVHMDADAQIVYDRVFLKHSRGEDFLQKMHVETVLRGYRKYMLRTRLKTLIVNSETANPGWTCAVARRLERKVRKLRSFTTYIGYDDPSLLLVGEKRGDERHGAAFVPYATTSGHYMLSGLLAVGLPRVGIANALEEDLPSLWETIGRPPVVALGRTAQRELKRGKIPHGVAPHPQYARRFVHKRRDDYARLILEVAQTQEDRGSWPRS